MKSLKFKGNIIKVKFNGKHKVVIMKKNIISFLFIFYCFCITINVNAQNANELSDEYAQLHIIAQRYLYGINTDVNYEKAHQIYIYLAERNDAEAINSLAGIYKQGLGIPANMDTARVLFKRASDLGSAKAAFNLAQMYRMGQGGEQDYEQAFLYTQQASDMGNKQAYYGLGYFYYKGLGTTQDYTKAIEMFNKGSELGLANCDYFLGLCYLGGYGVEKDIEKGKSFIEKSVAGGSAQAADFIANDRLKKYKDKPEVRSANILNRKVSPVFRSARNAVDKDISGIWEGKMIKYDWSGSHIVEEKNLSLQIDNVNGELSGIWVQEDSISIKLQAHLEDTAWVFDNMKYTRAFERVWEVKQGKLELEQVGDSLILFGNIEQFSVETKELSSPTSVVLKRTISKPIASSHTLRNSLIVYPNPFELFTTAEYNLEQSQNLSLQVFDQDGKVVYAESYNADEGNNKKSLQLNVPTGVYTLSLKGKELNLNSILIKK